MSGKEGNQSIITLKVFTWATLGIDGIVFAKKNLLKETGVFGRTCFVTLPQNELKMYVVRFTTHVTFKPVLQQTRLLQVA